MSRLRRLVAVAALLFASASRAASPPAGADEGKKHPPQAIAKLPGGVGIEALRIKELPNSAGYELEGDVTIRSGHSRIQADHLVYRDGRTVEADGNVLIVWAGNRISGDRMTYDLKEERGVIENAMGQMEPEFYFVAKSAEKVGQDVVLLEKATVTTCTQPVPYWSFSVSHARIELDHYAHMWNIVLRAGKVPVFYTPYLLWPAKRDRAAGLLIPSFGSNLVRGRIVTLPLYIPIGQSVDLTLTSDYYTIAGAGWGADLGFVPNPRGVGRMSGFFIRDQVTQTDRYRFSYTETQQFQNGFRMVADVNQMSDFNFFNDYERDLRLTSLPTILGRVEFSRNGGWTSINVRELRREQLFSDGTKQIQTTLPEIEWRGRSRHLGTTPFYLSFESSVAAITQSSVQLRSVGSSDVGVETFQFPLQSDYLRGDLFPTLSAPFSPFPWLDITPSVNYRYTYYTQHQTPAVVGVEVGGQPFTVPIQQIVNESITRSATGASLEFVGPKAFRIFKRPENPYSTRYKNVLEPFVRYVYQQAYGRAAEIIPYDQVDVSLVASNLVGYGFRTRLYAQRPRAKTPEPAGGAEAVLLPEGTTGEVRKAQPEAAPKETAPAAPAGQPAPMEPVEIASIEIQQSRSFGRDLTVQDINGDGIPEHSRFSSIDTTGRYNPKPNTSLDLRTSYDILSDKLTSVSLSGNLRGDVARTGFSLVRTASAAPFTPTQTQLRLAAGVTLFSRKLKLDVDGSYDASQKRVPDQRWSMEYYTQCCGFLAEWFKRDYVQNNRGEFRFTLDLRGVGKLLDIHQ